ncbi:MAG TPA: glycosyltransferase family 39 protein, partial [Propionibacteriaceae bacterium]
FETTTFDMVTTAAALWLFVRAMRSEPQRWTPWIAAGVLTGVAMEIKMLAAPLLACCLLVVLGAAPGIGHRRHRHREHLPGRSRDRVRALRGGCHGPDAARR